jgi:hypothetical protein
VTADELGEDEREVRHEHGQGDLDVLVLPHQPMTLAASRP